MNMFRNIGFIDHTLQVTSFGGVGTTMLYRFLEEHEVNTPSGHDWLPWKHLPAPPADNEVKEEFRAVYVFGNPMNAVLSVFRRDYQRWHIQNMREDITDPKSPDWGLDEFLQRSEDPFRMRKHFREWTHADRSYPILYLYFDALWEHLPEFFAFTGLPTRCLEEFPDQRERASDWTGEPTHIRKRLQVFYGDLHAQIEEVPECWIQ